MEEGNGEGLTSLVNVETARCDEDSVSENMYETAI
jgi:hypothetical protein